MYELPKLHEMKLSTVIVCPSNTHTPRIQQLFHSLWIIADQSWLTRTSPSSKLHNCDRILFILAFWWSEFEIYNILTTYCFYFSRMWLRATFLRKKPLFFLTKVVLGDSFEEQKQFLANILQILNSDHQRGKMNQFRGRLCNLLFYK